MHTMHMDVMLINQSYLHKCILKFYTTITDTGISNCRCFSFFSSCVFGCSRYLRRNMRDTNSLLCFFFLEGKKFGCCTRLNLSDAAHYMHECYRKKDYGLIRWLGHSCHVKMMPCSIMPTPFSQAPACIVSTMFPGTVHCVRLWLQIHATLSDYSRQVRALFICIVHPNLDDIQDRWHKTRQRGPVKSCPIGRVSLLGINFIQHMGPPKTQNL